MRCDLSITAIFLFLFTFCSGQVILKYNVPARVFVDVPPTDKSKHQGKESRKEKYGYLEDISNSFKTQAEKVKEIFRQR